ncbi:MAG: hypothetical protein ACE5GN_06420 [Waddliaceae bacterium]
MIKKQVFLSLFMILLSDCATLFSARSDTLTIKTEPSGADVYLATERPLAQEDGFGLFEILETIMQKKPA